MPDLSGPAAVKGPASYFQSIEKICGQPIAHWLALVAAMGGPKHMEKVAAMKIDQGLGHGHSNALVASARARKAALTTPATPSSPPLPTSARSV